MFGKLFAFSALVFAGLGRTKEPIHPADMLMYADAKMKALKCPDCESFMTLACVSGTPAGEHQQMCSKCGVLVTVDARKVPISFDGYKEPIRAHYLQTLQDDMRRERIHPRPKKGLGKAVADEVEAISMASYFADRQAREEMRKAA